jgi:hypothetical protein
MYEEMMVKHHGEWMDFFMDTSLEFDEPHNETTSIVSKFPFLQTFPYIEPASQELEVA